MKKLITLAFLHTLFYCSALAQTNCISVMPVACEGDCVSVTYIGPQPATATYSWTNSCGSITNPNAQNPHTACFPSPGVCTLTVVSQVAGAAPQTCTAFVEVGPIPKGFIAKDTIICAGECVPLVVTFTSGSPPFTYVIDDGNMATMYTTNNFNDTQIVCPSATTTYTLQSISGSNCTPPGPFNSATVTVIPSVVGSVVQNGNTLCAQPSGLLYQWYQCNSNQVLSTSQCLTISQTGCYCVIVGNDICKDTICDEYLFHGETCPGCPPNTVQGPDLITNGDFSLGNTGFTSDYVFTPSGVMGANRYSIRNSTNLANGQWSCLDHTNNLPLGNFLICDGSTNVNNYCYRTTVAVIPGRSYRFCAFANNLVITSQNYADPVLEVRINGAPVTGATLTETPDNWVLMTAPWTATSTTATIEIRSTSTSSLGNDFALDDISFRQCEEREKCDQISAFVEQLHIIPPACCFRLFFDNQADSCFKQIHLQLNSATFADLSPDFLNGWSVSQPNPGELILTHNSGFIPVGNFQTPVSWCVVGGSNPDTLQISFTYFANGAIGHCDTSFVFSCPFVNQCCRDFEEFCDRVQNAVTIVTDDHLCKAKVLIGNLPDCDYIHNINWGDGNTSFGPFAGGSMAMHTYAQSGTYVISYVALETNPLTGQICFEKLFRDTITLNCRDLCPHNLVPNPSFEQFTNCPTGLFQLPLLSWSSPTTGASPDYYNSCASLVSGVSTPSNSFGNQAPRTGAGYAGFILRPVNVYREYLEVPLTSPLTAGVTYQVSFYVSLADQSRWAIDQFGAYLSIGSVGPIPGAPVLPFVPQIVHPVGNYINSKTAWTQVTGNYTALGGEDHLVIGNFSDNINTVPQVGLGGFYNGSYYYLDDVSVCPLDIPPCDLTCDIVFEDSICIGDTVTFAYSGNASPNAIFNWVIDVPNHPGLHFFGVDSVQLVYEEPGCYNVSVTVMDQGCFVTCSDTLCVFQPKSEAALCCDIESCDTCATLTIFLGGAPPWTVFITDGQNIDTIPGITQSPYQYTVCPPQDTTVLYTLLQVLDSCGICPAYLGNTTASVSLFSLPNVSIVQNGNMLCAMPANMAGYGWYNCPAGGYLSTSQCFTPTMPGCYCVDVSNSHDCVDTACISIPVAVNNVLGNGEVLVYPNPGSGDWQIDFSPGVALPVSWEVYDALGRTKGGGSFGLSANKLQLKGQLPQGIYIFDFKAADGRTGKVKVVLLE